VGMMSCGIGMQAKYVEGCRGAVHNAFFKVVEKQDKSIDVAKLHLS
jgi:hypothetical protein